MYGRQVKAWGISATPLRLLFWLTMQYIWPLLYATVALSLSVRVRTGVYVCFFMRYTYCSRTYVRYTAGPLGLALSGLVYKTFAGGPASLALAWLCACASWLSGEFVLAFWLPWVMMFWTGGGATTAGLGFGCWCLLLLTVWEAHPTFLVRVHVRLTVLTW